ncbi:hypothetical protein MYX06_04395 [Patescibacteria group bacterium AH-259-L05]|nr:hypothetical protein [Patescibacteria group bacterium AH-259-L05]
MSTEEIRTGRHNHGIVIGCVHMGALINAGALKSKDDFACRRLTRKDFFLYPGGDPWGPIKNKDNQKGGRRDE